MSKYFFRFRTGDAASVNQAAARRIPHARLALLGLGTLLYFMANVQRVAIPGSIFDTLQRELSASAPEITMFGAAFMYVYALNQLIIGVVVERYGGRHVIAAGALLFCLGSLLFPLSHSLWCLYLSRALTGLGASSFYLSLVKEIKGTFSSRNFSLVFSLTLLVGYTGGITANAPFAAGATAVGWRPLMLGLAIGSVVIYLLFLATGTMAGRIAVNTGAKLNFRPFLQLLKNRDNLFLFVFCGMNFGVYYVLQTVLGKKFLIDFCELSASSAGWVLSLTAVFSALSGVLLALLNRFFNGVAVLRGISASGFASVSLVLVCLFFDWRTPHLAWLFCLLASVSSTSVLAIPIFHAANPPSLGGPAVCLMNFNNYVAVAVLGNLTGLLLNLQPPERLASGNLLYGRGSYIAVFSVLFLFSVIAVFCAWRMMNSRNAASETGVETAPVSNAVKLTVD